MPRLSLAALLSLLLPACIADDLAVGPLDDLGAVPEDLRVRHDFARDFTDPPAVVVVGRVLDETGAPIAQAWVSVCDPLGCNSTDADVEGRFRLPRIPVLPFGLRSHDDLTLKPLHGTVVRLFSPDRPDVEIDAGTLYVPLLPPIPQLTGSGAQTLDAGDGLSLTVTPAELAFPLGLPSTGLGARRIPLDHAPPFDLGGETLLAAWAIVPYATTSKIPIGVAASVPDLHLEPGAAVRFRAVYEFDGKLGDPASGHASADGKRVSTDPGVGLGNLTWVLLSR